MNQYETPGFSIVIPCFNEEQYIPKLLSNLDLQLIDRDSFEIIVVDNASTDKTSQVVWDYAYNSDLNIRLVHEYTKGVSAARNAGAAMASGETIIFLDADNKLDNKFLLELSMYMSEKKCVAGSICTLPDEPKFLGWVVFLLLELIKTVLPRPFGKSFVERRLFHKCGGFNEGIVLGENVEFMMKVKQLVKRNGGKFGHFRPGIRCSLRRFHKVGYSRILGPWFVAYLGHYKLSYKTMTDINDV